jgi:hypothetical protein
MTDAVPEPRAAADPITGAPPPRKKPRRGFPRAGFWLLAILVLALGAVGTSPFWGPLVQPYLPSATSAADTQATLDARLAAIERRLDNLQSLSDRIGALERRPAPDPSAAVAPLESRLQQLDQRVDRLETRLSDLIKDQSARGDSAQRVLIVALADLGNAIAGSQPFATQLASVEALGQARRGWVAKLHPLEDEARTGLPSTAILAQRFTDEVAPAILRAAAATPDPQAGLGSAVLAKLRALVIVRRTDGTASDDPVETAVATAEAALGKGDLGGATAALSPLDGPPKAAAAAWLQTAQQRLQAQQVIAELTQEIAADLAAGANGG